MKGECFEFVLKSKHYRVRPVAGLACRVYGVGY